MSQKHLVKFCFKIMELYKMDEVSSVYLMKNIAESWSDSSSDSVLPAISIVMNNLERVMYCPALVSWSEGIQILNIIKFQATETSETFFNKKTLN